MERSEKKCIAVANKKGNKKSIVMESSKALLLLLDRGRDLGDPFDISNIIDALDKVDNKKWAYLDFLCVRRTEGSVLCN